MIIEVVGKEIEKIKGDFESYLNGLNMVGEISYSQYSELYDEGTKQIQKAYELGKSELEKENERLTVSYETLKLHDEEEIGMLKSENAELKDDNKVMADNYSKMEQKFYDNLTKAKELLKQFLKAKNGEDTYKAEWETEQFLKDSEVEK